MTPTEPIKPLPDAPNPGEPVRIAQAVLGAVVSIWGVVVIAAQINATLAGAVTAALASIGGAVTTVVLRGKVTPN